MAVLTTQVVVAAGTTPTYSTPATGGGDTVEVGNGVNTFLHYKNTTTAKTVTLKLDHLTLAAGGTHPDKTYALGAPGELWIPLQKVFANAAVAGVGRATVTIDTNSTALVAVVKHEG